MIKDARERKLRNVIAITDGIWRVNTKLAQWAKKNLNTMVVIPYKDAEDLNIARHEKGIKALNARVVLWKI